MQNLLLSILPLCLFVTATFADEIDFDRDIALLLSRRCLGCHSGDDAEAELNLTSKATASSGGENGTALVPGNLEQSLLWQRVAAGEMPEDKPLPADERELLKQWILDGAQWGTDPIDPFRISTDSRAGYDWWSLQPLVQTTLPPVNGATWPRNAIDVFVLNKLEKSGLRPSAESSQPQLIRRLYFDITGLPPKPADLARFQSAPNAYEQMVDALLASPKHGQRWARHWLDVVRFGESHGFEYNQPRNHSWWYRDWVIESINSDLPYDEFARLQLAGDVLHPNDTSSWAATGFIVAGPHNTTKPSSQKMQMTMRHDELEDIVGAIGQTFLALTVNCARCHDHKFDPITQKEYYQLVASVVGIDHGERELPDERAAATKKKLIGVKERLKKLGDELKQKESNNCEAQQLGPFEECLSDDEKEMVTIYPKSPHQNGHLFFERSLDTLRSSITKLQQEEKRLEANRRQMMYAAVSRKPPPVSRLRRGDVSLPAETVQPQGLRAVNEKLADFGLSDEADDARRRTKLAEWVTGNQNPLLARVIVNRLWQYHFGSGLVRTSSDFGFNGDRPSHPKLLEYLAAELIRHDWNLKPIHRLITTSATYRQASHSKPEAAQKDADNRLLWRMTPRRLTAEEIRDTMLSVSDQLNDRHGGPGYRDVKEYKYRGSHYYDPIEPQGVDAVLRTVYRFNPRGAKRTILDTFDCPDPSAKAPKRESTITPLQALSLFNNRFVLQTAEKLAATVRKVQDDEGAIQLTYKLVYGRAAETEEVERARKFISRNDMSAFCRVILNSNEFLYVR